MSYASILLAHSVNNLSVELYEVKNIDREVKYYEVEFVDGEFGYTEARKKTYGEAKEVYDNLKKSLDDGWTP
jgi:hypothetical protein